MRHRILTHPEKNEFTITTNSARFDVDMLYDFLSKQSDWAEGASRQSIEDTLEDSLCFGLFYGRRQVGFASIITDFRAFAYLSDVFILPAFRGEGLSKWLMESILTYPSLKNISSWMLVSENAKELYAKFGFKAANDGSGQMEKRHQKPPTPKKQEPVRF
jgi:GNAT superfamily N-acetyltransferase